MKFSENIIFLINNRGDSRQTAICPQRFMVCSKMKIMLKAYFYLSLLGIFFIDITSRIQAQSSTTLEPYWVYSSKKDAYAIAKTNGQIISDYIFQQPIPFKNGRGAAKKDSFFVLLKSDATTLQEQYNFVARTHDQYFLVMPKYQSKHIFIDSNGQKVNLYIRSNSVSNVYHLNQKVGLIDSTGNFVTPPIFDGVNIDGHKESLIVRIGEQYGLVDNKGRALTSVTYDYIIYFKHFNLFGAKKDGQMGLLNHEGSTLISPKYEEIIETAIRTTTEKDEEENKSTLIYRQNNLWGFIDKSGLEISPPEYEDIDNKFFPQFYLIKKKGKWGVTDAFGKVLIDPGFSTIEHLSCWGRHYFKCINNLKKYKLFDQNGKPVTNIEYDAVYNICKKTYAYIRVSKDGLYGILDMDGNIVIPMRYSNCRPIDKDFFMVSFDPSPWGQPKRYGLIDKNEMFILPVDSAYSIDIVNLEKRIFVRFWTSHYILQNGVEKFQFEQVQVIKDHVYAKKGGKYFLFDNEMNSLLDTPYDFITSIKGSPFLYEVRLSGKKGVINDKGLVIAKPIYDEFMVFKKMIVGQKSTSLATIKNNNKKNSDMAHSQEEYIAIDINTGKEFPEFLSNHPPYSINQYIYMQKNDKIGLLDDNLNISIPFKFRDIRQHTFSGNSTNEKDYFYVRDATSGLLGFWECGKEIIPCQYTQMGVLTDDMIWVESKGKLKYLNKLGQEFSPMDRKLVRQRFNLRKEVFDRYENFGLELEDNGLIRVERKGKWGWIDKNGVEIISCRFDASTPFKKGKARVKIAACKQDFQINTNGEIILAPTYYESF